MDNVYMAGAEACTGKNFTNWATLVYLRFRYRGEHRRRRV
jgi:hypothetical protein